MLTTEAIDARVRDYCARHHVDPQRAQNRWIGRRHPQLVRFMMRLLVAQGRAAEIPADVLESELPPRKFDERARASALAHAERRSYHIYEL